MLVVSAQDGAMPQTREHVVLARRIGVEHLVVALNKADLADDEDLLDLVELEVRELLTRYGFDGDAVPVVRVSGLRALEGDPLWTQRILDLLAAVDEHVPIPPRRLDLPFLMPIENVLTITGRGTVVTGAVEQGTLAVGDAVEVIGLGPAVASVATGLETFGKPMERAEAGRQRRGAAARGEARRGPARAGRLPAGQRPAAHAVPRGRPRAVGRRGWQADAVRGELPAAVPLPHQRRRRGGDPRRGRRGGPAG